MGLFDFILGNKKRSIEKNNPSEQFDQSVTDELVKIIIDDETITIFIRIRLLFKIEIKFWYLQNPFFPNLTPIICSYNFFGC